jgi:ABC-type sugar transport system ATPase subunit
MITVGFGVGESDFEVGLPMSADVILDLTGISKRFPGVIALNQVDLEVRRGEVHGLVGENGAGKSTLISILNGVYRPDGGQIKVNGVPCTIGGPSEAAALGMSFIHQEPTLFPDLSVTENIFPGDALKNRWGFINEAEANRRTRQLLTRLNLRIEALALVRDLRLAEAQMVEIMRAVSKSAQILIMDEPTSSLTDTEKQALFDLIASLKGEGVSIIYISHFLDEVIEICDRVTVMKDGKRVSTNAVSELSKAVLIQKMIGRDVESLNVQRRAAPADTIMSVRGLSKRNTLHDINFDIRRGEIVGICGLLGAGKTELAEALFGLRPCEKGRICIDGRETRILNPIDAIEAGLGFVTESRLSDGIFAWMSVKENTSVTIFDQLSNWLGILDQKQQRQRVAEVVSDLGVRSAGLDQLIMNLSGGNQQKVVLGKWLLRNPKVLILDEPTRGIDVGAKREVYRILGRLSEGGTAILLISSESDEVYDLSDRIIVMQDGRMSREFPRGELTRSELLSFVTEKHSA